MNLIAIHDGNELCVLLEANAHLLEVSSTARRLPLGRCLSIEGQVMRFETGVTITLT